ncbi:MAG: hypothetical protein DRP42_00730 [Tenericutes bacterium]|nr:MAG: hypothetical protein DRP42_00730 [Mycoplasmatota bacterium]
MLYPYERFVTFLLSRKVDVNGALARIELPTIGAMGLADRKDEIRSTAPIALLRWLQQPISQPDLLFREGVLEWAGTQGFRGLWERQVEFGRLIDEDLERATNIFLNPHARTVLGTLLLAESSFEDMAQVLLDQFSIELTLEMLTPYRQIFWDMDVMGRTAWEKFIPELDDEQRHIIALGLRGLKPNDIRYAIGSEVASDPSDVLQDILTHAHNQFRQAMSMANPGSAGAFRWAELANRTISTMANTKKNFGGGEEDGVSNEMAGNMFSVELEVPKIISLDELQGDVSASTSVLDRAIEEHAS